MNTEQLRAEFEAWARNKNYDLDAVMLLSKPPKFSHYANPATQDALEAYQAGRAALQSQDMKPVIEALGAAQSNECGPHRPLGSSDPDSVNYDHDAFMWDYYQRAIDHARRGEGDSNADS